MAEAPTVERSALWPASCFSLLALVLLGTRPEVHFLGGASRRLMYNLHEIFESARFGANKLTHALPGTLWIAGPLEWALQYPELIIASVWIWTLAELVVGLGLIFGLATRLFAFGSIGLNISF